MKIVYSGGTHEEATAKKLKYLLKKQKKVLRARKKLVPFKEPTAMLIRNDGTTEFYEDVRGREWSITHSDGTERIIFLNPAGQTTINYGDTPFKCYICHEDRPVAVPMWIDDRSTGEEIKQAFDKLSAELEKLKRKATSIWAGNIKQIAIGIAIIIAAIALFSVMTDKSVADVLGFGQQAAQAASTAVQNSTTTLPPRLPPSQLG